MNTDSWPWEERCARDIAGLRMLSQQTGHAPVFEVLHQRLRRVSADIQVYGRDVVNAFEARYPQREIGR